MSSTVRALAYATFLRAVGRGLFITVSVIFFKLSVGLQDAEVGLGLTIAGAVGLAGGLPAGRLADVVGPRRVQIAFAVVSGLAVSAYALVGSFAGFVIVAAVVSFADAGESAARGALVGGSVPADQRVKARAFLRAVTNVGWTVGGLGAGAALHFDARPVYLAMIFGCSAAYLGSAALGLRVPRVAPVPRPEDGTPVWLVLRDRPYAMLSLLNAVLFVQNGLFTVALPLWVVSRTSAPPLTVAALAMLNTITVTLLQMRLSRGSDDVAGAARAQRRAGVFLLGACVLFALAAGQPVWVAVTVLIAGGLLHVFGELLQAAGSWGLSYELAPEHAIGQYQGLYQMGQQAANIVAPALLTAVVTGWGSLGWLLVGALFLGAGLAVPMAARSAQRARLAVPAA
ncbi:MFS transporter [Nonomuraea sp. NBC_01738]|uniref:MFS transporter n=1 Tax=Nonomuraea sp. NBC_01738 TaxID=2976003 RepID=UPI002E11030B|nr:MFS transporter [Nonomuraea sp. NBC_01738]